MNITIVKAKDIRVRASTLSPMDTFRRVGRDATSDFMMLQPNPANMKIVVPDNGGDYVISKHSQFMLVVYLGDGCIGYIDRSSLVIKTKAEMVIHA